MKTFTVKIRDAKPEVGIFEIVDGVFFKDSEESQPFSSTGQYFDGNTPHRHREDIKTLVKHSDQVAKGVKQVFETDPAAYLRWPRGRVSYDTINKVWTIMAAKVFFTPDNIEQVTREFHLPPYASGKIELIGDDGHYGY